MNEKIVCEIVERQKMKTKSRKGENDLAEKAVHVWSKALGERCVFTFEPCDSVETIIKSQRTFQYL